MKFQNPHDNSKSIDSGRRMECFPRPASGTASGNQVIHRKFWLENNMKIGSL